MNFYKFDGIHSIVGFSPIMSEIHNNLLIIVDNGNCSYKNFQIIKTILPSFMRLIGIIFDNIKILTIHPKLYTRECNWKNFSETLGKIPRFNRAKYEHINLEIFDETIKSLYDENTLVVIVDPINYVINNSHHINSDITTKIYNITKCKYIANDNILQITFESLSDGSYKNILKSTDSDDIVIPSGLEEYIKNNYDKSVYPGSLYLGLFDTIDKYSDNYISNTNIINFIEYYAYNSKESNDELLIDKCLEILDWSQIYNNKVTLNNIRFKLISKKGSCRRYMTDNVSLNNLISKFINVNQNDTKNVASILDVKIIENIKNIVVSNDNLIPDEESMDIYSSLLTLSNWYDEIMNKSCICLGSNVSLNKNSWKRLHRINYVTGCNTHFISFDELIDEYCKNIDEDEADKEIIFRDMFQSQCNVAFPLYINKQHWNVAKMYYPIIFGMLFCKIPFAYSKKMWNIMFHVLIEHIDHMYEKENIHNKYITILLQILRTCNKIAFEVKYDRGIHTFIENIHNISKYDYLSILGQIISLGLSVNDSVLRKIFIDIIHQILCNNKKDYENYLNDMSEEVILINDHLNRSLHPVMIKLNRVHRFYKMLMSAKITNNGMKALIDVMDNHNGILPDYILENFALGAKMQNSDINEFKEFTQITDNDNIRYFLSETHDDPNIIGINFTL